MYQNAKEHISTITEPNTAVNGALPRSQQGAAVQGHNGSLIQILILQAISLAAQEQDEEVRSALGQALRLAEGNWSIRPVRAQGMSTMLSSRRVAARGEYASAHLAEESGEPVICLQPPITPVSPRELDVLRRVAAGYSNQEIAQELVLAISTVKKHVNNIYNKLGVSSRTQAVARARGLQIL